MAELSDFRIGDRVTFTRWRGQQQGTVMRVGRRYLTVQYVTAMEARRCARLNMKPRAVTCTLGPHEVTRVGARVVGAYGR